MVESKIVGIDLGTTFSAVGHVDEHGSPQILADEDSVRLVPSVLLFEEPGKVIVGRVAKQLAVAQPDRIVEFVKREIGKTKEEFFRTFDGITYDAEQLSSFILKKLIHQAENALQCSVAQAIITVPACFNDQQRTATKRAGELAGLEVRRLLDEPVAAAIASGVRDTIPDGKFLVFDLGGGTLDVSIVNKDGAELTVLATEGDHLLGGKNWDDCLIQYAADRFKGCYGSSPLDDLGGYQDLQARANQARESLSKLSRVPLLVQHSGRNIRVECTRELLESLSETLLARCQFVCESALNAAHSSWSSIQMILLAGGATRMPMITALLEKMSRRPVGSVVNPDEVVALGAALVAAATSGSSSHLLPVKARALAQPRECTAHSLGVIVKNSPAADAPDILSIVIPKGSPIGKEYFKNYSTLFNNQTTVGFRVIEGESLAAGNQVGECVLTGLPASPAGRPLRFELHYDSNHLLTATGQDVLTGASHTVTIDRFYDPSPEDLAKARFEVQIMGVE